MENQIIDLADGSESLALNSEAIAHMTESRKWGKFLAIVGFIFTGLFFVTAIILQMVYEFGSEDSVIGLFIGLSAILYFLPSLFLFRYSSKIQGAIGKRDSALLAQAFQNEKLMYRFMGILTVLILGVYAFFIAYTVMTTALNLE